MNVSVRVRVRLGSGSGLGLGLGLGLAPVELTSVHERHPVLLLGLPRLVRLAIGIRQAEAHLQVSK